MPWTRWWWFEDQGCNGKGGGCKITCIYLCIPMYLTELESSMYQPHIISMYPSGYTSCSALSV